MTLFGLDIVRLVIAILVAPLVPGMVFGILDLFGTSRVGFGWYLAFSAKAGYPLILTVGAFLYWLFIGGAGPKFLPCLLIGLILGGLAYVLAFAPGLLAGDAAARDAFRASLILLPVAMFCGGLAGASFWIIARP